MKSSLKSLVSSLGSAALVIGIWSLVIPLSAAAQAPQLINYQGRLLNGTNLVNGNVGLSLRLFDAAAAGTKLYEDSNSVTVVDGLYSTFIGDDPVANSFLSALTNAVVWVEVAVNGTALTPRERLASVGYSLATRGIAVNVSNTIFVLNPAQNAVDPSAFASTVGGGISNSIQSNAPYSVLGGGQNNRIQTNASGAVLGGGLGNSIQTFGNYSFLGGGENNAILALAGHSFLGGGYENTIGVNSGFGFLGSGYRNSIQASSRYAVLVGGQDNSIQGNSAHSFLGGGLGNQIRSDLSVLGGGYQNTILTNSFQSVLGGGRANTVSGGFGTVPGGRENSAGAYGFAAGRRAKATNEGSFVWADSTDANFGTTSSNQFLIRASGGVGIGKPNPTGALDVAGTVTASNFVGSGAGLSGLTNFVSRTGDTMSGALALPAGGLAVGSTQLTVLAGGGVGIGTPGDSTALLTLGSSAVNALELRKPGNAFGYQFYVDANGLGICERGVACGRLFIENGSGNVGIGTGTPTNKLHVIGRIQASGDVLGQTFVSTSDRNAKQDIAPVDAAAILEKISALPVATWSFKTEPDVKHIGPMAQDFRAAFGLGPNDTSIATVDADGVALAAIQALAAADRDQKSEVRSQQAEIEVLKQTILELHARLDALEKK